MTTYGLEKSISIFFAKTFALNECFLNKADYYYYLFSLLLFLFN